MSLYKKYSFLVIDTTLASSNHLHFKKKILERIQKLIMKTDDEIRDKKLQYDINREAAKISSLSSDEKILPSNQIQVIEKPNSHISL